ncbi:MAG: hypothetical protein ACR2OF_08705 [Hyphomicrobium sp.]
MDQVISAEVEGETFTGRYEVKAGCVIVRYVRSDGHFAQRTAPVGASAEDTARTLLRELVLEVG